MSQDKFGKTISSSLYRLSDALWLNETREKIENLVKFVVYNDSYQISKDIETETFQKIVFGNIITDKHHLRKFKQAAISLARIKNEFPEIVTQLKTSGNRMHNMDFLQFVFFKHNERVWRVPEKNKEMRFQNTNSFVLFVPSLSRVLSFETPEENLLFERFRFGKVKNVHLQEIFSKIRGNARRKTFVEDKFANFFDIKFIFRTIHDAKMIYAGNKLENFSFVTTDDAGEKTFKIVFYFVSLGKILEFESFPLSSNRPANMKKIKISDTTGEQTFQMFGNIDHTDNIMNDSIGTFFGLAKNYDSLKFHKNNFVLTISRWALGEPIPEILYLRNLGHSITQPKIDYFYMLAYMNTRKKVNSNLLEKMFPNVNLSQNKLFYSKDKWTYEVDPNWSIEEFEKNIRKKRDELEVLQKGPSQYLKINEFFHKIYISDNPEKEIAESYNLDQDKICLKCGRELFELSISTIGQHIENSNGKISVEFQSVFNFNNNIDDALESIKVILNEICSSRDEKGATKFVREIVQDKKYFFKDINDLDICNTLQTIFGCIKEFEEGRIFFEFPKNNEIITIFLKLENPRNICLEEHKTNNVQIGKNCVEHGSIENTQPLYRGKISLILEHFVKKEFEKKQKNTLETISKQIFYLCSKWNHLIDLFITKHVNLKPYTVFSTQKNWSNICSSIEDDMLTDLDGTKYDLSPLKKISVENISFFIFCYLVTKHDLRTMEGWKNILDRVSESKRLLKSNSARQTGNIGDMNLLLRIIAFRFLDFHYKNALGKKNHFDYDVLKNSLQIQMERCTFVPGKKNSRRYQYLNTVSFESEKFLEMCKMLLTGEISGMDNAERTLAKYKQKIQRKKLRSQRRISFSKQKEVLRQHISKSSPEHADTEKITPYKEKHGSDLHFEHNYPKMGFESSLEDLNREWKRLVEAKALTHSPQKYQEMKKKVFPKIQFFMKNFSSVCPKLNILKEKSLESKEIKKFFKILNIKKDFTEDSITKILDEF